MPLCRLLVGLGNLPAGEVGTADVDHLPLAHELLHRLPDLLPGRGPIHVMHLVEVDMIGLQATKTIFASLPDVIGREPPIVRALAHRLVDLGRQDDPVAPTALSQPAPDDLLGEAVALLHIRRLGATVHVCGIEEVDVGLQGAVHDLEGGWLVRQLTEVQGAQAQPADQQTGAPQVGVLQGGLLSECARFAPMLLVGICNVYSMRSILTSKSPLTRASLSIPDSMTPR
ncbi:hypothetical protein D3C87_1357450 [compost metagenome]